MWVSRSCSSKFETRMVVQGQLVEPLIRFSDLFDVFLYDKVRDINQERQNQVNSFDILTKNPNLKKKTTVFVFRGRGGGGGGGGAAGGGEREFFFG